ncbi:MAG TPA: NAD(P)-dependent alcohol dehydrogenase [Nitrososphaera sp.]|nr:NAD(P)-dependent alcohol dehydrogenase [Nitrososphaera sp.]
MHTQDSNSGRANPEDMIAARLHQYQEPLVVESVPKPSRIPGESVLVKVGAAGLCHSDLHLMNGEWKDAIPLDLPLTPGHENAGWVEEIGETVPQGLFTKGETVAVFGGWGCGICSFCKGGDEQLCIAPHWPGLSRRDGGYSEFMLVPSYRFLVKVPEKGGLIPEEIAPLTDAGLTPYRAVRKVRHLLGPGTSIAVVGMGGLGSYGIQYARLLAPHSTVIAIDRSDRKLDMAKKFGADFAVNSASTRNIRDELLHLTAGRGVDVVLDTVGAENTIGDSAKVLAKGGALVIVGLFGNQIRIPLLPAIVNEHHVIASLWGSYNELKEVIELASQRKIKHAYKAFPLKEINRAVDLLRQGQILGRAVIVP